MGQYDRAEQAFSSFLDQYPAYPAGWRATFRLAEIFGRRQGDKAQEQSRKWYYDTINRYPYSPGAVLARMSLIPCDDHGGFTIESASKFYSTDAQNFDGGGEVVMNRFRDYRGLANVRAMVAFGQDARAVDVAIQELQSNPRSQARLIVGDILGTVFRKSIMGMLAEGKKYEALNFYREKSESVPQPAEPDYLLKLSQAASDLNLGSMAESLAKAYDKAAGTGRSVAAESPSGKKAEPDFDQKLRDSEKYFTEAKALFTASGTKVSAEDAKTIREKLLKVIDESEFAYQREIIQASLDEKDSKFASALGHAIRAELFMPAKAKSSTDDAIRVSHWIATLQARAGSQSTALALYRNLEKARANEPKEGRKEGPAARLGVAPVPSIDQLIAAEGEILAKQGKWGEAAASYARGVDQGLGGNQMMFEYARALGRSPASTDQEKSRVTLKKIADSQVDDFWRKLAREALANQLPRRADHE
jgi:hypothetical protein